MLHKQNSSVNFSSIEVFSLFGSSSLSSGYRLHSSNFRRSSGPHVDLQQADKIIILVFRNSRVTMQQNKITQNLLKMNVMMVTIEFQLTCSGNLSILKLLWNWSSKKSHPITLKEIQYRCKVIVWDISHLQLHSVKVLFIVVVLFLLLRLLLKLSNNIIERIPDRHSDHCESKTHFDVISIFGAVCIVAIG